MPLSFSNLKQNIPLAVSMLPGGQVLGAAANALMNKKNQASTPLQPITPAPVQAAPAAPTKTTAAVSKSSPSTLALQQQLNQQNSGKQGWVPLVEDGILGPKTQAAISWQPINASSYTPPMAQAQQQQQQKQETQKKNETKADNTVNFGGILFDLIKKATEGDEAVNQARADLTKFRTATADKIADIRSDDIPLEFQQGRAQVVQQAAAEKEAALATNVETALQQQQQQLAALQGAAGLTQPVQVPYNNQFINPQTGLPIGGGAAGGSLQDAVSGIAQKVMNGTMGYDAGVAALSGYGQAGVNALQQALGPNFNIQQSNATARAQEISTEQTGTLGGQLTKQADTVKNHMVTLQQAYDALTAQSGIPAANAVVNWFKQQTGSPTLQSYNLALQNVRDELAKILGGGTATEGSRATAVALLPDNMTPQQLKASIATATELMDSKIAEYTRTPSFNNNQAAGGSGLYNW